MSKVYHDPRTSAYLMTKVCLGVSVAEVYLDFVGVHNPRGQWSEVRCTMSLGTKLGQCA